MDCDFDRLDLSTNPYLEKNLEFLCNWIDDLSNEQIKFNQYTRNVQRQKQVYIYIICIHEYFVSYVFGLGRGFCLQHVQSRLVLVSSCHV